MDKNDNIRRDESVMIPIHGSMKRPANPDQGIEEIKKGAIEWDSGKGVIEITYETDEFTSVCPTTGQPDFNTIQIMYMPDDKYIESKTMKFYLWSFREHGSHCETLARRIATDIYDAIQPLYVRVVVNQKARGGLKLKGRYVIGGDHA